MSDSKAVTINNDEILTSIKQEVQDEFITSDREVYKDGLRSLLHQEQQYRKQMASIQAEIDNLDKARAALDEAFKNGTLHSIEDARGVTRTVKKKAKTAELWV